jgi:hypothetical protein
MLSYVSNTHSFHFLLWVAPRPFWCVLTLTGEMKQQVPQQVLEGYEFCLPSWGLIAPSAQLALSLTNPIGFHFYTVVSTT